MYSGLLSSSAGISLATGSPVRLAATGLLLYILSKKVLPPNNYFTFTCCSMSGIVHTCPHILYT